MTPGSHPADPAGEAVDLMVAADPTHLPLARVVALASGALAGLPMDDIDDLRQCTQEALAILLAHGCTGHLTVRFESSAGSVRVAAHGEGADATAPDPTSFAWLLLTELAPDAHVRRNGPELTVGFHIVDRVTPTPTAAPAQVP